MVALHRHCLRATIVSVALVWALAVAAAVVRLLPWVLSPEVPFAVALPFASALLAVAFEAAFLIGVPAGCALGAALLVERGEARVLHCSGMSPESLALRGAPLVLAAALLAFATASAWQASIEHPGRFARDLVTSAQNECTAGRARSISVPFVGVTWLCFADGARRITGPVPNSGGRAWFSAHRISVTDDFTAFAAEDVYVGTEPTASKFRFGLRARRAHVSGLPAWGQTPALSPFERASLLAGAVFVTGLFALYVVVRGSLAQRVIAGGFSGLAGVLELRALHAAAPAADVASAVWPVLAVGLGTCALPLIGGQLLGWWTRRRAENPRKSMALRF